MSSVTIIGIDLAKRIFHAHSACSDGNVAFRKRLTRAQVLPFLAKQPACVVAMEACASAHEWGRAIQELGHDVRLYSATNWMSSINSKDHRSGESAATQPGRGRKRGAFRPCQGSDR